MLSLQDTSTMRKIVYILTIILFACTLQAQVFSGNAEIEGFKREGFFIYVKGSEENILSSWKNYVKEFGAIEKTKNSVLTASNVKIPSVDSKGLPLLSKVITENEKIKLFINIQVNSKEVIQSGHADYRAASNWLEDFSTKFNLQEGVRLEEEKLENLIRNRTKIQKTSERLLREIEANIRQTELLQKKLEEVKLEKEKIITNTEQNKLDIQKIESEVILQRKNLETAKQKLK